MFGMSLNYLPFYFIICLAFYSDIARADSLFDIILGKVAKCTCDRTEKNLDVSKIDIYILNLENNKTTKYPVQKATQFFEKANFDTNSCFHVHFMGFTTKYDVYEPIVKYITRNLKCNSKTVYFAVIDSYSYFNLLPNALTAYRRSVKYAKSIAYKVSETLIIPAIQKLGKDNVYIAGHSLGAHMAGYSGDAVNEALGYKPKIIVALDPAGPCFEDCPEAHVNSNQADVVTAFHCDIDAFGSGLDVTDYDFYAFDGVNQPQCGKEFSDFLLSLGNSLCNHYFCVPIAYEPANAPVIWKATACPTYEAYESGACSSNVTTSAGYPIIPNTTKGKYYFEDDLNLLTVAIKGIIASLT